MQEEIMAYIAGTLDGDGSFSLIRRVCKDARIPWYTPMIQLANVNPTLPEFLHSQFGGNLAVSKPVKMKSGRLSSPQTHWKMRGGDNVKGVLEKICDYLIIKKERAKLLLQYIGEHPFIRSKKLSEETLADRERWYLKFRELNDSREKPQRIAIHCNKCSDSSTFWAYVAGLMDTDGSFSIKRQTRNAATPGVKNHRYSPYIQISLVTVSALGYIFSGCPFGKIHVPNNKTTTLGFHYTFSITSREDCIEFIDRVLPFLRVKKAVAEKLREFCLGYMKTGYAKAGIPEEQLKFRERCYKEAVELNLNGVYKPSLIDLEGRKPADRGEGASHADRLSEMASKDDATVRPPV